MSLKDLQEKTGIFQSSNDALCLGLNQSDIDYLKTIGVEPVVINTRKDMENISEKFNILVLALNQSVFSSFAIIERYTSSLLPNAKILIRSYGAEDMEDIKKTVPRLSKPLNLEPQAYTAGEKNTIWITLSRIRK